MGMKTWRVCGLTLAGLAMGTAIALHTSADNPAKAGDVTEARIASETAAANNWLLNGRTFDSKHFSPLQQITDKNIGGLGLAWSLDIESGMGVVSEPIVVDGVIYVSAPLSEVRSEDPAESGDQWVVFGAGKRGRGGVEWKSVRGDGRLPVDCY
jgi:quinohemoprotein ethanol dehydrogenase